MTIGAQGLGRRRPKGKIRAHHVRQAIDQINVLQLDAINVVERTQFLVLFSRVGSYDRDLLHSLNGPDGEIFEYWAHAASVMPVTQEPLLRWRMDQKGYYTGEAHLARVEAWRAEHADYIEAVRDELHERGPLAASDLTDPRRNDGEWWDRRSTGRQALEYLFSTGEIAGWRAPSFERVYDLRDRVIPAEVRSAPTPTAEEAHRQLLYLSAQALGVATIRDLADYYRINATHAAPRVAELVDEGRLVEASVEGWKQPGYLVADTKPKRRARDHATLLSPFDSLIWNRPRTKRVFDFDFKLEVYVPEKDRRFGYFVLPLLHDDELVARFDLKADRKASVLRVRGAYLEDGAAVGAVAEAAAAEVAALAAWLGLDAVKVGRKGNLSTALRAALAP